MARPEKVAVVDEIRQKLDDADAAVLTEYRGLTVSELAELRAGLREAATEYKVFKNTLARRAVEGTDLDDLLPLLDGPVAFAFVHGDAAVAAKALKTFARDHEALVLKGGLLDGRFLEAGDVRALAEIPPRDELLARLAGAFQAPLTKAAGLFQAFPRNVAQLTQALIDQRVEAGEQAPPVAEVTAEATDEPAEAGEAESSSDPGDAGSDEHQDETSDEVATEAASDDGETEEEET